MTPVQLNPVASSFLVAFYVVVAVALTVLIGALALLVSRLNAKLNEYEAKIGPILEKADHVLTVTSEKVNRIGGKAETILTQGEEVATVVHERVDRTTAVVQRTINAPLIGINSLAAGMMRAWETFAALQSTADRRTETPGRLPAAPVPVSVRADGVNTGGRRDDSAAGTELLGKEI